MGDNSKTSKEIAVISTITLPILPVDNQVLFPGFEMEIKIAVEGNEDLLRILTQQKEQLLGTVVKKSEEEFYQVGTIGKILRFKWHPLQSNLLVVVLEGMDPFRIIKILQGKPYYAAEVEKISVTPGTSPLKVRAWAADVIANLETVLNLLAEFNQLPFNRKEIIKTIRQAKDLNNVAYMSIAKPIFESIGIEQQQEVLEALTTKDKLAKVDNFLKSEISFLKVRKEIRARKNGARREHFLRRQREAINRELGESEEEDEKVEKKYRKMITRAKMPPEAKKESLAALERLSRMPPHSSEYPHIETWLDKMIKVPWSKSTKDREDLARVEEILERDHYGLPTIKRRILEFLAVRKLNPTGRGPILAFIGPPGTGKTSVGKSIAKAMNRKFVRISLGGVHDEAQIRGHRSTYVGALPGMIVDRLIKVRSNNPVFMIDEIDKIGASAFHGDPSSALLEALDPEQNSAFSDNYLGVPLDLSRIMFICTGNLTDTVQPALLDRMEILGFSGYTKEEKLEIAKKYLVARQLRFNGLRKNQLRFTSEALQPIIENYTGEAGVRNLEREISRCCRQVATRIAKGEIVREVITEKNLAKFLGPKRYLSQTKERISQSGVTSGLAYTSLGGRLLFIEAEIIRGIKRPALEITGNVAKVMKESAETALTFVTANLQLLGIKEDRSPVGNKIHIHVPEAATPKDGPSAGLAMFTTLVSRLKAQKVRSDVAMTGEITLRGKVLPVGGIKEKVLAAKEGGIRTIILPIENKQDEPSLSESVKKALEQKELKIIYISEMTEALEIALEGQPLY